MYKCDRCYDRIDAGQRPACIEVCPEEVQKIGPRKEILEEARNIAKAINGHLYGDRENGGTNTIYVSPASFEILNEAIPQGAGKPHLKPVKDAMSHADNLTKAMVFAPFAGFAAAAIKFMKSAKNLGNPEEEK
jgi:hypothetical protein